MSRSGFRGWSRQGGSRVFIWNGLEHQQSPHVTIMTSDGLAFHSVHMSFHHECILIVKVSPKDEHTLYPSLFPQCSPTPQSQCNNQSVIHAEVLLKAVKCSVKKITNDLRRYREADMDAA